MFLAIINKNYLIKLKIDFQLDVEEIRYTSDRNV